MKYGSTAAVRSSAFRSYERSNGNTLRLLPMKIGMWYLSVTFLLFLLWPVNWPIYRTSDWISLIGYVTLCFVLLAWLFSIGSKQSVQQVEPFSWRPIILIGGVLAVVLLFPVSYVYTDRWPWQVLEALGDQKDAYSSLQTQLLETQGQRGPIAAARALTSPLTFAVLPLGIIHWRESSALLRSLIIGSVVAIIILSILRGTDREIADLGIISLSAVLVIIGRQSSDGGGAIGTFIKKYWKLAIAGLLFVAVASALFTERKSARLGGFEKLNEVCVGGSQVCADIDSPLISWMPEAQRFGISIFIISTASGYYGLNLAMEKDFQSTYGIGHSAAALSAYELISGDRQLVTRTYTYRNAYDGWSEEYYWSSLITWIANDVGFLGASIVIGLIGLLWGKAWAAATYGKSDPAAVIFCVLMLMILYLPANNQILAVYDGYFIVFTWLIIWKTGIGIRKRFNNAI